MFENTNPFLNYLYSKVSNFLDSRLHHDCDICIGFSGDDHINRTTAYYLKLIFEAQGINVKFSDPSTENIELSEKTTLYCAVVPSNYGTIRNNNYKIGEQTLSVIKQYPKCKILFVYCHGYDNYSISNLVASIEEETLSSIETFNFSDLIEDFFVVSHSVRKKLMPIDPRDGVNLIMTSDLMTVDENDRFSELYFKMTTLDVRHCPVLRTGTRKCVRMISKRDLVQQIPPANLISDDEYINLRLDRSKINQTLRAIAKKTVKEMFPLNQQLITVSNTEPIESVIKLLAFKQRLGDSFYYISGVPVVLSKEGDLAGFVSYTDALKFIKDNQTAFLKETRVEDVATIAKTPPEFEKISYLTLEDDLAMAKIQLQTCRSLPVVGVDERNWIGFVDDLKVKMFSHVLFMEQLQDLSVQHFMIASDKLPVITYKQTLAEIIHHFLEGKNGMKPPSTFVVTEKVSKSDTTEYQRVIGMISYTDILRKWTEWRKTQQNINLVEDVQEIG